MHKRCTRHHHASCSKINCLYWYSNALWHSSWFSVHYVNELHMQRLCSRHFLLMCALCRGSSWLCSESVFRKNPEANTLHMWVIEGSLAKRATRTFWTFRIRYWLIHHRLHVLVVWTLSPVSTITLFAWRAKENQIRTCLCVSFHAGCETGTSQFVCLSPRQLIESFAGLTPSDGDCWAALCRSSMIACQICLLLNAAAVAHKSSLEEGRLLPTSPLAIRKVRACAGFKVCVIHGCMQAHMLSLCSIGHRRLVVFWDICQQPLTFLVARPYICLFSLSWNCFVGSTSVEPLTLNSSFPRPRSRVTSFAWHKHLSENVCRESSVAIWPRRQPWRRFE